MKHTSVYSVGKNAKALPTGAQDLDNLVRHFIADTAELDELVKASDLGRAAAQLVCGFEGREPIS